MTSVLLKLAFHLSIPASLLTILSYSAPMRHYLPFGERIVNIVLKKIDLFSMGRTVAIK